ncbi:MAG TPA: archease [Gemmatimonadales bacterium]|jgi:SHS2 domain-containing protein|nr:archease [Gemmatimonadales bacterium]
MEPASSHELIDHISELRLRLRAGSLAGLLAEAGHALAELQLRGAEQTAPAGSKRLQVTAPDRDRLLVDWLNELIYLAEAERWVATEFEIERVTTQSLEVRASGVEVPLPRGLVKAATMHGLRVHDVDGRVEAEVILDV